MKYVLILLCFIPLFINCDSLLEKIFTSIYHNHSWQGGGKETVSGGGSTLYQTTNIRKLLQQLLKNLDIKILLNAPCGDFNWMSEIDILNLELYIGIDIVEDLIHKNKKLYGKNNIIFYHKDISNDTLPNADLILCRDLFLHIKYKDIFRILKNFKKNTAKYLLVSTYANTTYNVDRNKINNGYRPINLELPPFNFPKPLLLINDFKDKGKYMGLWEMKSIPKYYCE